MTTTPRYNLSVNCKTDMQMPQIANKSQKSISINIINLSSGEISSKAEKKIKKAAFLILKLLNIKYGHLNPVEFASQPFNEVNINLVSPLKMRGLNKKYRGKNKISSVLSFTEPKEFINPPALFPLGEIFLCPSKIKNEAQKIKIPYETRLLELLIHGVLHLVGYTHDTKKREQLMQKKEKIIFKKILDSKF